MTSDTPDPDRDCRWLGSRADGELDPDTRRRVDEWVESDPRAAEVLRDQEQLSPANAEFWAAVEPPPPADGAWDAVRDRIAARCQPAEPVRPSGWTSVELWGVVAAVVALSLLTVGLWLDVPGPRTPPGQLPPVPPDVVELAPPPRSADYPLAGYAVLPMPKPGEVLIESVRGGVAPWVIGPEQPVPDVLALADPGDVELGTVRPAAADGMMPDSKTTTGPTGSPMIYAAPSR